MNPIASTLAFLLTAIAAASPAVAQCTTPDAFEPNNSCAAAAAVTPGLHTNLTVLGAGSGQADPDFYEIDVPPGDRLLVEVFHTWAEDQDLSLYLYDASIPQCGDRFTTLAEGFTWTNNETASWSNSGVTTITCIIEVAAWDQGLQPMVCDDYDMRVTVGPAPCLAGSDDSFEPNDSCGAAVPIGTGTHFDLVTSTASPDFYRVPVAAGERIAVDLFYGEENQDGLVVELYDGPNCLSRVASDAGGGSNFISWANASGVGKQTTLVVRPTSPGVCNEYGVSIAVYLDPCLATPDDSFEPNDDCASATPLTVGTQTNRFVSLFSPDHYRVTVQPGDRLLADVHYSLLTGELVTELYSDPACMNLVDSMGWTGTDHVEYANSSGAAQDLYVVVRVAQPGAANCNRYDMDLAIVPDGCLALPDDGLEPNDDCASAVLLAPGIYSTNYVHESDPDYYLADVPAGYRLTIDIFYTPTNGALELGVYPDTSCTLTVNSASGSGSDRVLFTNDTASATQVAFRVQIPQWIMQDCNNYDLSVQVAPEPCLNTPDDGFEENDTCATAVPITPGLHTGLFVNGLDRDYYQVTVGPLERLTVDCLYPFNPGDGLNVELFEDTACSFTVDFASWTGADRVTYANATMNTVTWTFVVSASDAIASQCNTYDLSVSVVPDACLSAPDDAYEDNDDCNTATPLGPGTLSGLWASFEDNDYFKFDMAPGGFVQIDLNHTSAAGDLDLYLFDIGATCGVQFNQVASSVTSFDLERVLYTNNTASTITLVVQVAAWESGICNSYDLTTTLIGHQVGIPTCAGDGSYDPGSGPQGCPCGNESALGAGRGCRNSTGQGALLEVSGTNLHENDDLVFEISGARPNQTSLLIQGTVLTALPFKDGLLCMGNPTERLEIVSLDATGSGASSGSIVTLGSIAGPGVTRFYQQWYRDPGGVSPCGSGSNFTNGMIVNWN